MNQSTSFAQVATNLLNLLQGYTKGIRFLLVMFLTLTVSATAWADYTITFKTGSGSEVTTKAAIINSGGDYVSSVSASKTYADSDGLRYGSGDKMGYTTFTLSNAGQIKASKIIFQGAKYYSTDNSSLQYTITYTDATTTSGTIALTNTATDKEATLESSKTISKIDIRKTTTSKKRFYVQGVKVVSAAVANHTVTFDAGSGSCSTPNFTQTSTTRSIDLPTATTTCEGWTFAGWCISSAGNQDENSTSPGTILLPGDPYTPSSNHTLYAIYTRSDDGASATTTESYGFENSDDETKWTINGPVQSNSYKKTGSYAGRINTNDTYVTYKEKVNVTSFSFQFMRQTTNNNYNVYVETSPDNNTWTAVETYTMSSFTTAGTWYSKSHTFDGKTALYIRFHCNNTTAVRWVDDVSITYVGGAATYYMTDLTCATQTVVTLNPNGGTPNEVRTYTTEETSYTLPECPFSRTGYTFAGWNTKVDGSGTSYEDKGKIENLNGTPITLYAQWNCTSPTSVGIEGTYHFFPGETITLTATPIGGSTPTGYQWQKFIETDWQNISGATSATYKKVSATVEDVGQYRCVVTTGTTCSATSDAYNVKCLQLYVYWDDKSDKCNQVFTKVDATTATISIDLENSNYKYYFKITDGCGDWYGLNGDIHSGWCTDVPLSANEYCGLQTTKLGTYVFNVNYSDLANLTVSVIYPSGNQEAGKVIYWDNNVLNWTYSDDAEGKNKIYYRIGRSNHNTKQLMQLVPGTANLYQVTTTQYDNFEAWHIANNGCWSDNNSIYKTNTGDDWAATAAMAFEPNAVTDNSITVTPTNTHSTGNIEDNNNCEFYTYDIATGMKTWNAQIIPATGGTITVSYTHHDGTAVTNFISDDRDLAHTCLLTITATPDAGYKLGTLTVNDEAFTSGDVHTLTEDAVIKVTWTEKSIPKFEWSATTYTAALEADNTFPTLNNPDVLSPVTYTSSNTGVATIDEDGNITLVATGTTTITATGAETATHKSATATYELTVAAANCKWVEIDIEDIHPTDEVVVTMGNNTTVYALHNSEKIDPSPKALQVAVQNGVLVGTDFANYGWYVTNIDGGYQLQSCSDASKYLYGVKSYITLGNTATTFYIYQDQETRNECFAYIADSEVRYLGHGTENSQSAWKNFTSIEHLKSNTLKFYKRECLDASKVWVEDNFINVTCDTQLPQQLAKDGSITLTFTAADGYALPNTVTVTNATKSWNQTTGELTISNPTGNVMVTVSAVELHTITWKVGSNSVLTEKVANATGVTQTPDNPANGAIGECANAFMGWTETPLGSAEGQSAPADLCTAAQMKAKHTSVTGDKTFYAVFATEEPSNTTTTSTTTISGANSGTIANVLSWSSSKNEGTAITAWNDNHFRLYPNKSNGNESSITITPVSGVTISEVVLTATSTTYAKPVKYNIDGGSDISGNWSSTTMTISDINATTSFKFRNAHTGANNDQVRVTVSVTYSKGGTSTTYSNYVTNCCELLPVTNLQVSGVTEKSATLTWTKPSSTTGITELQIRNTNDEVVVEDINPTTTTATINGLYECTKYNYYVVSVGAECEVSSETVTAQPFSGAKIVNYDYNGGSGSPASFTTSCENQVITLPTASRSGYTFNGWYDAASGGNRVGGAGEEYNPATSPITLYAQWTEGSYTLTHSGNNYTNTENKTTIKSSDTPFTLNYTCTGDYGFPSTISISGGGKSWAAGTGYVWTVAADKQSARLTINQTTISANVTITINMATRYTVTFEHHDKGIFDGESTIEVLSSENTITLPTVEDVSCGFYDTFEGWIVSNDEYVESTTKPATVYAGGASYRVTGDCTFRALYSKCEGDATQVYRKVTATGEVTDGTYILVATTTTGTSYVYSGNGGNTYGLYVSGLTTDAGDFSSTLPDGTDPISITVNDGKFAMYNANESKYLTYTNSSNTLNTSDSEANVWKLTDGSEKINGKECPEGALTPSNDARVLQLNSGSTRFACYQNTDNYPYVFLYKLIDKCTKYYSTNPTCVKPVGVHIVYNANAIDASISCNTQDRTYKVASGENQYPELASQLQFCTNATREGHTLAGWNTQANGQGTTYNINQNYYRLPVSGELDGDNWITLNLYAVWKQSVKFDLGNATGGTGVPDAIVENGECVLPEPTAEQLGTIPCAYEFYAWSETSVTATQSKPAVWMPGDTYTGSATTLYAVYRYAEGMGGSDTYYFTFNKSGKTYCITAKHNSYDRFVVAEQSTGLIFGLENGYLYYLDEGVKTFVYWEGDGTTVTTTTTSPNNANQKTTFVAGDNGTTIVTPAMSGRYLQMPSSYTDRAYYTNDGINPTLVEVQTTTCTYATNPTCYTNTNLHFVTNGGTLNYPTDYDETNYLELTPGTTILMPTATFAGEWEFEGWKRGEPLENQTDLPYDQSFYPVTLDATLFEVDEVGDVYFYAVYSKTTNDKQFDQVNGGTYKLYAIQSDDTKIFMPAWNGGRGTMSGVTTCAESGDYTITPGTGEHAGQYQITCGEYTLGVQSDADTDLKEGEETWWNIEHSTSGKGSWRITVVGSSNRALSALSGSFGNYSLTQLNNAGQTQYRDMEIGECIFTEYTSTPENIPYITITGAPVRITSTNGERVYASTTIHIEAHNFTGERIIHLSATNGFGVTPTEVRTNGQGVYSGNVKVYYEPTTDGDGQTITTSVLTASQTGGTNAEKISQTFAAIQGRNMPANFVIAAKWDGHWYALPANCTSSLSSTEGLLIEVDDVDNPTRATQAPASAKYGIREVIPSRQTDHGQGVVFTERYSDDNKEYSLYNNGTSANLQVYSQYSNYAATNPERYEWTPSTTNFVEYTLTNANSSRKITLNNSGVFSATTASGQVRLLPATFYEPAPVQVLKWKENSVIVMYTGAETTATTQVGTNAVSAAQPLENQKLTHGIYELTTTQALTGYARDVLVLYFGANTKVEMEIPLIVSGNVTASANGHDVVILENSKLTAAATKYSYKDVYVYGGGKLAVPASTSLGVNNIILRAGGIATNGVGKEATYQYIYPQVELKGTLSSTKTDIKYEYVTDYDHWYHFVLPFNGNINSITYPTEYYGDHVALDNTGSWVIKRYDGATRATGNYNAWVDIESEAATTTTAGKGYIFWGAPKKVSVNGGTKVRQQWGIQRITMPITSAATAVGAENGDKTIEGLSSYKDVANNSGAVNDQGWNLIGNPYMVNLTTMSEDGLKAGILEKEIVDGNWTGRWTNNGDGIRYLTIPSDHFDTYEAKTVNAAMTANNLVPGRAFFVQLEDEADGVTFTAANRASLMPQHLAAQNTEVAVETGIILSNETMQDEMNFWIKDGKTNDYEYNADYPKTPNNTNFNIYGVHINGSLSWVATSPEYAEESMPIGYQVPAAGTYTLSISETYYSDILDALYVTDHAMSPELTVDLMNAPYEFSVNQAETNNERFTVSVRLKSENQGPTTGVDNTGAQRDGVTKFIYQDKMFILHNGIIYDATGKKVTTINK